MKPQDPSYGIFKLELLHLEWSVFCTLFKEFRTHDRGLFSNATAAGTRDCFTMFARWRHSVASELKVPVVWLLDASRAGAAAIYKSCHSVIRIQATTYAKSRCYRVTEAIANGTAQRRGRLDTTSEPASYHRSIAVTVTDESFDYHDRIRQLDGANIMHVRTPCLDYRTVRT